MMKPRIFATVVILGLLVGARPLASQTVRGQKALEAGKYKEAIAALEPAVKEKKGKDWCHNAFFLAFAYYRDGQLSKAVAAFDELFANAERLRCSTWGMLPAWHHWRGRADYDSGRFKEAAASFARAADLAPAIVPGDFLPQWKLRALQPVKEYCYNWLGSAYYGSGSYQEAVAAFQRAIEQNPKDALHYRWLAWAHLALKNHDDALAAAKRAFEIKPAGDSYETLGDVHMAGKRFSEAAEAFRKAADIDPMTASLQMKLGRAYLRMEDFGSAVDAFTKGAGLAPDDPVFPYRIALAHGLAGRFDEAISALDKSIGIVTYVGIGIQSGIENGFPVLQRQVEGEPGITDGPAKEAGLRAGDRLIKIDGQTTKGWDQAKISQRIRGEEGAPVTLTVQRQGVAKPFERTVVRRRIRPETSARYYGFRGAMLRAKGERERAVNDAELAYALDPKNSDAREALGAVRLDEGQYEEAIGLFSSLENSAFARVLEATAYAKKGDARRAVEIYSDIPDTDLSVADAPLQNARRAFLAGLQGHLQETLGRARASEAAGRPLEALADYAEATKIADESTAGLIRQREAMILNGDPSLAKLPEEARKLALRGDLFIKDGAFADALPEYRKALKLAPFNAQLHFNAALICGQLKDYRQAIRYMTVYLELNPDAPNARAAKDEIYKWEFQLEEQGKKKEA
jgi:tetratricopeptide (TPR) repeat protein